MSHFNFILATDSYKLTHAPLYPVGTEVVYSYFESRNGAEFPDTVFFGLQYILQEFLAGVVVTQEDIEEAAEVAEAHFGNPDIFNRAGWQHIVDNRGGRLPLRIKAVPEGMPVPVSNVMMTVENTDPKCFWLTNAVESILTHVWYTSVVATKSREAKKVIAQYLEVTTGALDGLPFMLHDFGYRGGTTHEAASVAGAAHLLNFMGTDTLSALLIARDHYSAPIGTIGYSVVATEHSNMTAEGPDGERGVLAHVLQDNPTGILSVVSDSYSIYNFVERYVGVEFKDQILARTNPDGSPATFVVRPDSVTPQHPTPEAETVWILESLWKSFGGEVNEQGYKVLDPHVRVLWGDGIDLAGVKAILQAAKDAGFAASNLVFGMGGGLIQKGLNRDTQRSAFKSSAQKRDGQWFDVWKKPIDLSKASKRGRLALIEYEGHLTTISDAHAKNDILRTVFENGEVVDPLTFEQVRANAELPVKATV